MGFKAQKEKQTRKQTIKIPYDKGYDRGPCKMSEVCVRATVLLSSRREGTGLSSKRQMRITQLVKEIGRERIETLGLENHVHVQKHGEEPGTLTGW